MVEVKYPCPQCKTSLKLKSAVPPGKKIKCPKCEATFTPVPEAAKPAAALHDDGAGTFGFKEDAAPAPALAPRKIALPDEDLDQELKPREHHDDVRKSMDKQFPKSRRGPAQAIVMRPSNQLLATASTLCVSCIVSVLVAMWPMVFSLKSELSDADVLYRWQMVGLSVLAFIYNAAITMGAVKMQSIESYRWAMGAAVMMLLPTQWALGSIAFFWFTIFLQTVVGEEMVHGTWAILSLWFLFVGIWNVKTLRLPAVKAGFGVKRET